jgi:hypothetical protein
VAFLHYKDVLQLSSTALSLHNVPYCSGILFFVSFRRWMKETGLKYWSWSPPSWVSEVDQNKELHSLKKGS